MLIAQVTLHAKLVDGRREVHAHFLLLGVVAHAHGDVSLAPIAPDVVGHLEANDENALVEFARSLAQRMRSMIGVERAVLFVVEVGRIVFVLTFSFSLLFKRNQFYFKYKLSNENF